MNIGINFSSNLLMGRQNGMLKSTQDKLQRQADRDGKIAFFEAQKENLKNMKSLNLDDISRKLDMLHSYNDEIVAAKQEYNSSQMFHAMDEAKERAEKIAKEAEKNKPKTEEERKEDAIDEALGTDDNKGVLTEVMDKLSEVIDESIENVDNMQDSQEDVNNLAQESIKQKDLQQGDLQNQDLQQGATQTQLQKAYINEKYVNIFFAPVKNSKNIPNGIIILLQDITEHVKLDNMRKEFVADVSHELKTPITSIIGYTETLLEGDYDKETQVKFLNVIESESKRMAKLVSDLLTLSRYDNNKNKMEKVEINLGDLTKKCLEKLKVEIEKKNHKIECFVTAEVPLVKADKYGIERVILNILTNAIKYTPENGNIKIYVGFVYNDAYIKVIDNGIGIPEKDLPRVFERFYRVEKARAREMGGTGLGLAIAKEIIEQNNGSINIKSIQGKGTEVVMRIPAKNKEVIENN